MTRVARRSAAGRIRIGWSTDGRVLDTDCGEGA